ncbi:type IV pilus assembly protein PilZ [Anopheles sinensis]|uniref:Type IV pilus assembly protein PilZ n=1 Tax=Anopheles sinensis TaxID=74873 RepID=A0A084VTY9_ANOSI|nr:type IV pilus assembly protein PilZ [Anopheles sinensis]
MFSHPRDHPARLRTSARRKVNEARKRGFPPSVCHPGDSLFVVRNDGVVRFQMQLLPFGKKESNHQEVRRGGSLTRLVLLISVQPLQCTKQAPQAKTLPQILPLLTGLSWPRGFFLCHPKENGRLTEVDPVHSVSP